MKRNVWGVGMALVAAIGAAQAGPVAELFAERGPYETVVDLSTGRDGLFSLFRPLELGLDGRLHPVITWGNGTFSTPSDYFELLDHFASHGFVVIASNSRFTGSGRQMLEGVDWVLAENLDPNSELFGAIDADAIGATGHSQGGGGTINAATDPRLSCSAPLQPTPGRAEEAQGPMLVFTGTDDFIVPPDQVYGSVYQRLLVPSAFAALRGGTHDEPSGDGGRYRGYTTAWFAWCLGGDDRAADGFAGPCELCDDPDWILQTRRAR